MAAGASAAAIEGSSRLCQGGQAQAGVAVLSGQLRRALEHGRIEPPQGRARANIDLPGRSLWISTDVQPGVTGLAPPATYIQQRPAQAGLQLSEEILPRHVHQQVTHARLFRPRQVEKQLQHGHQQLVALVLRHRRQGFIHRAASQAERQQPLAVALKGRQPQVMVMFEHGQASPPSSCTANLADSW